MPKSEKPLTTSASICSPESVGPHSSYRPSGPTASTLPGGWAIDSKSKLSYQLTAVVSVFMTHATRPGSLYQTSEDTSAVDSNRSWLLLCSMTMLAASPELSSRNACGSVVATTSSVPSAVDVTDSSTRRS